MKTAPEQGIVTSADGTAIGWSRVGRQGPALVLVHGGMEAAESHRQLAEALAGDFTVYLYDRRGRGGSGPFRPDHSLRTEVEDLAAVLGLSGARHVFGLSSGAIICLQAGLDLPAISKMALYEPPLSIDGSFPVDWVADFDREIAAGRPVDALVLATKATEQFGHRLPRPVLKAMARLMLGDMVELVPTFRHDARIVVELLSRWRRYADVRADVLLMGGGRSPAFLKTTLDALEEIVPSVRRVEFARLNHGGSGNRSRGGDPRLVAAAMRDFYGTSVSSDDLHR
ncbi:MAG: alpha/beta fold hydrolase [Nonomuraea sp.]|nr:alpha/beta fold hydrolase [Nonomuraea sp.]